MEASVGGGGMQMQQQSNNGNSENILMDRFLAHCELPVLGTSALEQILHQASLDFPPAMSPDSSQWTSNSTSTSACTHAWFSWCFFRTVLNRAPG